MSASALVKVTGTLSEDGEYIDPAAVDAIETKAGGTCVVHLKGGTALEVNDTADAVATTLGYT